jgi:excisionase family DNA binding protein
MNISYKQTLTIDQICAYLQISRTTHWRMRKKGEFPKPTNSSRGTLRWKRSIFEEWLNCDNDNVSLGY